MRPELILMRPNISVTAVVTGQVEFATAHGSIVRAAAQGMPVKSLMVVADRPAYYLVAKAGVNQCRRAERPIRGHRFARRLRSSHDQGIHGAE